MKNSMISILTVIVMGLMIQPVTAQNLQLEEGVTHPHTIKKMDESRMHYVLMNIVAENPELLHAMGEYMMKESPIMQMATECMQLCRVDEDHGQVSEHMSKMPDTMDKKYGHHEMMDNMSDSERNKMQDMHMNCMAMMHDSDKQDVKTDSDDHENHH